MWVQKKACWVWTAVDRMGKRFVTFVCGDRTAQTARLLWKKLGSQQQAECFCTDYWKAYSRVLPQDRHVRSKKHTYTVEGYNCRIRHYLARFHRRTLCYSKAQHMVEASLKLLFLKLNGMIDI